MTFKTLSLFPELDPKPRPEQGSLISLLPASEIIRTCSPELSLIDKNPRRGERRKHETTDSKRGSIHGSDSSRTIRSRPNCELFNCNVQQSLLID